VSVVQTQDELPQEIKSRLKKGAIVNGVFYGGKTWIVADNQKSVASAMSTVAHEVVGHYGIRALFRGDHVIDAEYVKILISVYNEKKDEISGIGQRYKYAWKDLDTPEKQVRGAEEWMARQAGKLDLNAPWYKRLVALVKNALRRLGVTFGNETELDRQVHLLIADAFAAVKRGPRTEGVGAMAGQPAFTFAGPKGADAEGTPAVKSGYKRLYRGNTRLANAEKKSVPDWLKDTPEYKGIVDATGRWFTPSLKEAKEYAKDGDGTISYIDVPIEEVERYDALETPGAEKFPSRTIEKGDEYFLPRELADKAQAFNEGQKPEDVLISRGGGQVAMSAESAKADAAAKQNVEMPIYTIKEFREIMSAPDRLGTDAWSTADSFYQEAINFVASIPNQMEVYRVLSVDKDKIDMKKLGDSWTIDGPTAAELGSHLKGKSVLVGTVDKKDIDLKETAQFYMMFSDEKEYEIRVKTGPTGITPVKNAKVITIEEARKRPRFQMSRGGSQAAMSADVNNDEYGESVAKTARPWKKTKTYSVATAQVIKKRDTVLDNGSGPFQKVRDDVENKGADYVPYDPYHGINVSAL